jgi:CubicO group peptidase (beta-lactamase class C family)
MANKDRPIPNRPDTIFSLASITKPFTAIAVAQLVQQGKMAFTDTLGAHLEGFPAEVANTVTVHQLLTHTSGVGRPALGSGTPAGLGWNSFDEVMDGTLAIIRQTPLQFTPGTQYTYSNDGFFVLGAIVAQVAGQSYFDYIRQHVFGPAGMSHTDFYSRPQVLADDTIARPYWTQPSGARIDATASEFYPFTTGPAGGAYSTVSDLLAFARALTTGKLLSPAFAELTTGGKVAVPPPGAPEPASQSLFYGYGHLDAIVNNQRILGHSGSGPGAATRLDIYPGLDWVSIVLSNYDTTINPIVELERELIVRRDGQPDQ